MLGHTGGGKVAAVHYTTSECYIHALELELQRPESWNGLGYELGSGAICSIGGVEYTGLQCVVKALELEPENGNTWDTFGFLGGGECEGIQYSQRECYNKALEFAPELAEDEDVQAHIVELDPKEGNKALKRKSEWV